jgi:ribokinase
VAVITVDDAAENVIIVVPGANGEVGREDLDRLETALDGARVLLLQLEVPLDAVVAAAEMGRRRGVTVILDPAPAQSLPEALYAAVDILTPNESEAAALVGFSLDDPDAIARASQTLLSRGVRSVIVKLGGKGVFWSNGLESAHFPTFPVEAVDSVGAGDAFNGGLAVGLSDGLDMAAAIRWGLAAGALSVTKSGAQPSMPDRAAVAALLG